MHMHTHGTRSVTMTMRARGEGLPGARAVTTPAGRRDQGRLCMYSKSVDQHAAAAEVTHRMGIGGLTWGMKASTPHSSMDTTTATALTILEGGVGWGVGWEKTVAWSVCVCKEQEDVVREARWVVVSKQ